MSLFRKELCGGNKVIVHKLNYGAFKHAVQNLMICLHNTVLRTLIGTQVFFYKHIIYKQYLVMKQRNTATKL